MLPEYIGPIAFGLKMGVILPGMDIVEEVFQALTRCHADGMLDDNDVICVTESIVARAQNNYITVDDIAREIGAALNLKADGKIAVLFPIASRNRFSLIMKGIARAVPRGCVIVQLSYPTDEVGNEIIAPDFALTMKKELISYEDLGGRSFKHPVTGVDYIAYYREIISGEGSEPIILLSNNPLHVLDYNPDAVIAADIHSRQKTSDAIRGSFKNCITLDQVFTTGMVSSEWGLLGSNMSAGERLKLAPRDGQKVVETLQGRIKAELDLTVQVMIYGDGAYLDPTSGIYELADPRAAFAATEGLDRFREGIKYKYLADKCFHEDKRSAAEIETILCESIQSDLPDDSLEREGTTPRRMEDVLASLADLVSGSADAGTPVVVVKGFLR